MHKPYTLLDHTADLRIRVEGRDPADLFANAGLALAELICDPASLDAKEIVVLEIEGDDAPDLMVNTLRELLYLWTGKQKLIKVVETLANSPTTVSVRVTTDDFMPGRHTILNEIKAVTYHQIAVEPTDDGWQATVVLDI
ncbi:Archease domain containing protein [Desulfosarcina cetonica]|nr:Archease domain containing protein [Desulfosarcina cetonica]